MFVGKLMKQDCVVSGLAFFKKFLRGIRKKRKHLQFFLTCSLQSLLILLLLVIPMEQVSAHNQSQIFFDTSGTDQGGFGPDQIITISGNLTTHGRRDGPNLGGSWDRFNTASDI